MIQCAAHSDTTFTTILATFENRGLEILDSDGKWVEVEPRPHSLVVNILLSKMSRDRFKATMHRWCTRVKIASLCRSFSSPMVVVTATFTSMSVLRCTRMAKNLCPMSRVSMQTGRPEALRNGSNNNYIQKQRFWTRNGVKCILIACMW